MEESKPNQLTIPFTITNDDTDKHHNPKNLLVNLELAKFPFFFISKSQKVLQSRIGIDKYLTYKKLKNSGLDDETIKKMTNFNISPADLIHEEAFSIGSNNEKWTIRADAFLGFPDEFDSLVWEYFLYILSTNYYTTKKINPYISFNKLDVINYLVSKKYFKQYYGKLYTLIDASIERLFMTRYSYSKGFYVKELNHYTAKDYMFSLIKNIYRKNTKLPNGEFVSSDYIIQIDPVIYFNFINNYFLISPHSLRLKLNSLQSKSLYDKLNYMLYYSLTQNTSDYIICIKYQYPVYLYLASETLYEFLGLKYPKGKNLCKSYLLSKVKPYCEQLIEKGFLSTYFVDRNVNTNNYNFFFLVSLNYADTFINNIHKRFKLNLSEKKKNIDFTASQNYFSKLKSLISEKDNLQYFSNIFPDKE